jgi:hypothetical protein
VDTDAAAVLEETAGAVDADAPVAAGAIADAVVRDVMDANYQLRNMLRIAHTSQPNNKDLLSHLSRSCCPASRCP